VLQEEGDRLTSSQTKLDTSCRCWRIIEHYAEIIHRRLAGTQSVSCISLLLYLTTYISYCIQRPFHRHCLVRLLHWFHLLPPHLRQSYPLLHKVIQLHREAIALATSLMGEWVTATLIVVPKSSSTEASLSYVTLCYKWEGLWNGIPSRARSTRCGFCLGRASVSYRCLKTFDTARRAKAVNSGSLTLVWLVSVCTLFHLRFSQIS
jgi:hypothetical protein